MDNHSLLASTSEQKTRQSKPGITGKAYHKRLGRGPKRPPHGWFDPRKLLCHTAHCLFISGRCATVTSLSARLFCAPVFLVCLLGATGVAQRGGLNDPQPVNPVSVSYNTAPGTGVLIFTVSAERGNVHLDRQALLKLVSLPSQSATWQTSEDNSQAVFTNVPYGTYDVEVSAVGYLTAHKQMQVMVSLRPLETVIVLHRDPEAVNLDVGDSVLPPKVRKATKRAVSALKSGHFDRAQKELDEAYKSSPSSPDLNFLLGYLYFQKKDFGQAESYLEKAANLNPHHAQALTLLGRTGLERQDYPAARSALEQAVLSDPENWLPHNLLADTYLHQKNYDKARDEAQVAIAKGKNAASPAQLVLGQALVNLGQNQEGIQALNIFLQESPKHPIAGQVRNLIAEIQGQESAPAPEEDMLQAKARLTGVDPLLALPAPRLSVKSWQ